MESQCIDGGRAFSRAFPKLGKRYEKRFRDHLKHSPASSKPYHKVGLCFSKAFKASHLAKLFRGSIQLCCCRSVSPRSCKGKQKKSEEDFTQWVAEGHAGFHWLCNGCMESSPQKRKTGYWICQQCGDQKSREEDFSMWNKMHTAAYAQRKHICDGCLRDRVPVAKSKKREPPVSPGAPAIKKQTRKATDPGSANADAEGSSSNIASARGGQKGQQQENAKARERRQNFEKQS